MDPLAPQAVTVIEAGQQHLGDLAALHRALFSPAWDGASFNSLMEQPGSLALLAATGRTAQPVGFIFGRVVADEAEILSLGVALGWQRRGIAARLVASLTDVAAARGACRIFLEVAADNAPARQLYLAQGFGEAGRRVAYYERQRGPWSDALIMSKVLQC
ncbi:MAG: GNAT family N-acetyltransferase [Hyphomicrobiaceae bacterium]|nr:GNAT family N-acetyltransferase [Hyphomicrobiaceae bacterium]